MAQDKGLLLTIQDDGIGFVPGHKTSGIGVTNMRTRAESFNGTFSISGKAGEGCLVEVRIPVLSKANDKASQKGNLVTTGSPWQHATVEHTATNSPIRSGVVLPYLHKGKV